MSAITIKMKRPKVRVEINAFGSNVLDMTLDLVSTDNVEDLIIMVVESRGCEAQDTRETIEEALHSEKGASHFYDHIGRLVTVCFFDGSKG